MRKEYFFLGLFISLLAGTPFFAHSAASLADRLSRQNSLAGRSKRRRLVHQPRQQTTLFLGPP